MPLDEDSKKEVGELIKGALTAEEVKKLFGKEQRNITVGIVNAATEKLATSMKEGFETLLTEKLEGLRPPTTPDPKDKDKGNGGEEAAQLRKEVEALKKRDGQRQKEHEEAQAKVREKSIRAAFAASASEVGFTDVEVLYPWARQAKKLEWDEEGDALSVLVDNDGVEEKVPIASFLAEFAKTETGKRFLPPTGGRGTGGSPGTPGAKGPTGLTRDQLLDLALTSG